MSSLGKPIVSGVLSPLFKSLQPATPAAQPAPTPMPAMPDSDDETVRAAKRKQAAQIQARSGRASTMLSDMGTSDKLGG